MERCDFGKKKKKKNQVAALDVQIIKHLVSLL